MFVFKNWRERESGGRERERDLTGWFCLDEGYALALRFSGEVGV